jgi:hypothetical protein
MLDPQSHREFTPSDRSPVPAEPPQAVGAAPSTNAAADPLRREGDSPTPNPKPTPGEGPLARSDERTIPPLPEQVIWVPRTDLGISPYRVPRHPDPAATEHMLRDVREHGVLVPLLAYPAEGGQHLLVDGVYRAHALFTLGHSTAPVISRPMTPEQAMRACWASADTYHSRVLVEEIEWIQARRAALIAEGVTDVWKTLVHRYGIEATRCSKLNTVAELWSAELRTAAGVIDDVLRELRLEPVYKALRQPTPEKRARALWNYIRRLRQARPRGDAARGTTEPTTQPRTNKTYTFDPSSRGRYSAIVVPHRMTRSECDSAEKDLKGLLAKVRARRRELDAGVSTTD